MIRLGDPSAVSIDQKWQIWNWDSIKNTDLKPYWCVVLFKFITIGCRGRMLLISVESSNHSHSNALFINEPSQILCQGSVKPLRNISDFTISDGIILRWLVRIGCSELGNDKGDICAHLNHVIAYCCWDADRKYWPLSLPSSRLLTYAFLFFLSTSALLLACLPLLLTMKVWYLWSSFMRAQGKGTGRCRKGERLGAREGTYAHASDRSAESPHQTMGNHPTGRRFKHWRAKLCTSLSLMIDVN